MTLRSEPYEHLKREIVFDSLERFEQMASERGIGMATLALAWLLASPLVNPIVVGPRKPAHLEPPKAALELALTDSDILELSALFPRSLGVGA
jgi:aryl-alcohol dehydrogenase-like predicted oxidoreductase